jgi:uncharacterized protein
MLAVVSPAKALDFSPLERPVQPSVPRLLGDAAEIGEVAKKRTRAEFKKLMHLSEALADLTYERFQAFDVSDPAENAKPAVFAYAGDTYQGFDVGQLNEAELAYAQDHFRILSGLYGLLKPMDLIKAHRLEMGTRLATDRGRDLYGFWGERIADLLNVDCEASGGASVIVNCASVEYFKSVDRSILQPEVLSVVFKEEKAGVAKVISFYAKRARGMMARYMVQNRIDRPEGLKDFNEAGYVFRPALSDGSSYVFTRLQD